MKQHRVGRPLSTAAVFLLACIIRVGSAPVIADVIHVPGDYPTIQAGIYYAGWGDTVLVAPGTYTENVNMLGREIVVTSEEGPAVTIVDASGTGSAFTFANSEPLTTVLQGFTLTNGAASCGGGVYCTSSSPTLRDLVLTGNTASYGGGIYAEYGNGPGIEQCVITGNHAGWGGGACCWSCDVAMSNSAVMENTAADPGLGAGAYAGESSTLQVTNTLLCGNQAAGDGGGVCVAYGSALQGDGNNVYASNTSGNHGGGIAFAGSDQVGILQNSILWGNEAAQGDQLSLQFSVELSIRYSDVQGGEAGVYVPSGCVLNWLEGMIASDPQFETGPLGDYHLQDGSPCIDAGNPDPLCNDPEDPDNPGYALWPALGAVTNDMGAYGGGGAGIWTGLPGWEPEPSPEPGSIDVTLVSNPFAGDLRVLISSGSPTVADVALFDLAGRIVLRRESVDLPPGGLMLTLEGSGSLCSGLYLLRVTGGAGSSPGVTCAALKLGGV